MFILTSLSHLLHEADHHWCSWPRVPPATGHAITGVAPHSALPAQAATGGWWPTTGPRLSPACAPGLPASHVHTGQNGKMLSELRIIRSLNESLLLLRSIVGSSDLFPLLTRQPWLPVSGWCWEMLCLSWLGAAPMTQDITADKLTQNDTISTFTGSQPQPQLVSIRVSVHVNVNHQSGRPMDFFLDIFLYNFNYYITSDWYGHSIHHLNVSELLVTSMQQDKNQKSGKIQQIRTGRVGVHYGLWRTFLIPTEIKMCRDSQ